jgi:uncharacterized Zn finger protein (UPF0148 family)
LLVAVIKFGKDGTVSCGKQELERAHRRWRSEEVEKARSEQERCVTRVAQASKFLMTKSSYASYARNKLHWRSVWNWVLSHADTVKQLYESLAQLDRLVEDHRAYEAECDRVSALFCSVLLISGVSLTSQCFLLFHE